MANDRSTAARKTATKAPAKTTPPRARAPRKTTPKALAPTTKAFPTLPPPGWYVDPADTAVQRWWDGEGWSGPTLPAGDVAPPGPLADETPAKTTSKAQAQSSISYRGRTMRVQMPSADQLAIWQRTATRLANASTLSTDEAMKLIQRAITLIGTVLVDEVDRDWVEESILSGDLDLMGAATILTLGIEKLTSERKAQAPPNGPAPKARRKR